MSYKISQGNLNLVDTLSLVIPHNSPETKIKFSILRNSDDSESEVDTMNLKIKFIDNDSDASNKPDFSICDDGLNINFINYHAPMGIATSKPNVIGSLEIPGNITRKLYMTYSIFTIGKQGESSKTLILSVFSEDKVNE